MSDKKKWMGLAAAGAAITALIARVSKRGNREDKPEETDVSIKPEETNISTEISTE